MESIQKIRDYLAEAIEECPLGVEVTGRGYGWNNGPYGDFSVKLASGEEFYVCIVTSEEDELDDEEVPQGPETVR